MKRISILLLIIGVSSLVISCWAQKTGYKNVTADEFDSLIRQENVQILDSRTQAEYDEGHIQGAVLIDVNDSDFRSKAISALDKGKHVAVYCRSGRRSRLAAEILSKEGFKVTNLDGGIISWKEAKKPTVK